MTPKCISDSSISCIPDSCNTEFSTPVLLSTTSDVSDSNSRNDTVGGIKCLRNSVLTGREPLGPVQWGTITDIAENLPSPVATGDEVNSSSNLDNPCRNHINKINDPLRNTCGLTNHSLVLNPDASPFVPLGKLVNSTEKKRYFV